ncbi:MAG: class I SAM-dependent RNA methyltransferase, partial [Longimicrobiales bacterium]
MSERPRGARGASVERLAIDAIAAGGAGVGRLQDGRVAFVPRTAPGDVVEARIVDQKRRYVRAESVRLIEGAPTRRTAPCPHYARCGGCTIEHLTYDAQLAAKRQIVEDALRRIGGIEIDVPRVVASPTETRYRNRVSFSLRRLGTGRVVAGFHDRVRADRLVDIDGACLLPEQPVADGWDALRRSWGPDASRLPSGERLRLTLRGTYDGALTLLVEGGYGPGRAAEILAAVPALQSIWHRTDAQVAAVLLAGVEQVAESWAGEPVRLGGAMFLQVNRGAAHLLEAHVLERVAPVAGQHIVDAYCGVGLHARRCARAGARVTGIELDARAVVEARRALGAGTDAEVVEARVEDVLAVHLPADVVIVNPPRSGLDAAASGALTGQPPARVVYVSC